MRINSYQSDEELINGYLSSGQSVLLTEIFNRYSMLVLGVCMKYLKDRELAQDAVMDIFEKLQLHTPGAEIKSFRPWLYVLCKNHCLQILRKRNENIPLEIMETEWVEHPLDKEEEVIKENKLIECLDKLVMEQKVCVKAFYWEKKSYQRISEELRFELKKVKSFIQNGKRNLKICMEG